MGTRMVLCYFDETAITEYHRNGLLPRIAAETFRLFCLLLSTIRDDAYEYINNAWSESPAETMMKYHSGKLAALRAHATSKLDHALTVYIYLRDSSQNDFHSNTVHKKIFGKIMKLTSLEGNASEDYDGPACVHCRSIDFHLYTGRGHFKSECPLKAMQTRNAKATAQGAVQKHRNNPGGTTLSQYLEKVS